VGKIETLLMHMTVYSVPSLSVASTRLFLALVLFDAAT